MTRTRRLEGRFITFGLGSPGAPAARASYLREHGEEYLATARAEYAKAIRTLHLLRGRLGSEVPPFDALRLPGIPHELEAARLDEWQRLSARVTAAEQSGIDCGRREAEAAVSAAMRAVWYLDELGLGAAAHFEVHRTAELLGGAFGCLLRRRGGCLWDTCPITLSHIRFGLSAGFTARRMCSICSQDLSECEHLPGLRYRSDGQLASGDDDSWQVATSVVQSVDRLTEVSLVRYPRDPLARVSAIESASAMSVGSQSVRCWRCVAVCQGWIDMPVVRPDLILEAIKPDGFLRIRMEQ